MTPLLNLLVNPILYILPILVAMAFLTLLEWKTLGCMQLRKGPNIVGPQGLLQPVADGVKLFIKEPICPSHSSPLLLILAPLLALLLAMVIWSLLPMPYTLTELNLGLLFMLAVSSMAIYSILWSGWASNSKYALMGALRAIAQTISYKVTLGIILLSVVMVAGGFTLQVLSITQKHNWLLLSSRTLMMMWYMSTLAETNWAPFDLTEGESELVSGFNVEYAAGPFALLFLTEYGNIFLMNSLSCILFMNPGMFQNPENFPMDMMTKTTLLSIGFLWVRASYPRFRYDQLMHLLWKQFLPITLALCLWHISFPIFLLGTPQSNRPPS